MNNSLSIDLVLDHGLLTRDEMVTAWNALLRSATANDCIYRDEEVGLARKLAWRIDDLDKDHIHTKETARFLAKYEIELV